MSGIVSITLTGDVKLLTKLKRLGNKDQKAAIRKASRAAARPILQKARELAPRRKGALARSLKLRAIKRSRTRIGVRISTSTLESVFQGKTFYGAFLEFGTKRIAARHFMQRAVDQTKEQAKAIFAAELAKEITAAAMKN